MVLAVTEGIVRIKIVNGKDRLRAERPGVQNFLHSGHILRQGRLPTNEFFRPLMMDQIEFSARLKEMPRASRDIAAEIAIALN